jgi:hypothetical protein
MILCQGRIRCPSSFYPSPRKRILPTADSPDRLPALSQETIIINPSHFMISDTIDCLCSLFFNTCQENQNIVLNAYRINAAIHCFVCGKCSPLPAFTRFRQAQPAFPRGGQQMHRRDWNAPVSLLRWKAGFHCARAAAGERKEKGLGNIAESNR